MRLGIWYTARRMKTKYDFAFGLGYACSCSLALRAAGLQFESFPFDWNICQAEDDLVTRAELVRSDFAHWLDKDDLSFFAANVERDSLDVYKNSRTKFVLIHDFERGVPFDVAFPCVADKYNRRIARLYDRIRASRRVLVVRLDSPIQRKPTTVESCRKALAVLTERFPDVTFDLILLTLEKDRPLKRRIVESVGDRITRITFDYRSTNPDAPAYLTNSDALATALKALVAARDYRTPEQRRAFTLKRRQTRWAKFGATNRWQYLVNRLKRRLLAIRI